MSFTFKTNTAFRIIFAYLLIGVAWILFSDWMVYQVLDRDVRMQLHTLKGWLFVGFSAALIYFLTNKHLDQLACAHRTLFASEERLNLALTVSRMGVWEWDLITDHVVWSSECYEVVGLADFDGSFESFARLLHPEDAEHVITMVQQALTQRSEYADEFRIIRPDSGEVRWLCNHGRARYDEDGTPLALFGTVQDVTARKRIEQALLESEARYRAVVEDQTEVITRCLPDGTFTFVNDVYCRLFGTSRDELIGRSWQPVAVADDIPMIEEQLRSLAPDNPVVVIENRVLVASGNVRWMQFVNRGYFDHDGKLIETQSVGRDITDRKLAEESLRLYARRLVEIDEELRRTLAAELHDEIGRDLTALGISAAIIEGSLPDGGNRKLSERLKDMRSMLESVSRTIQGMMAELRPPVLDDYGLPAALRWYCDLFALRMGLAVELDIADDFPRLAPAKELALFRIAQEALGNVSKHANAKTVRVSLERTGVVVQMAVGDDGCGMDPDKVVDQHEHTHWGLTIMRERAQAIGGNLEIGTASGRGTTITVILKEGA